MSEREPGPQPAPESVWDYPRPPRLERVPQRIEVVFAGVTIVDTTAAYRVLETSHPPNYYLPEADVRPGVLRRNAQASFCEWKGLAHYYDVVVGDHLAPSAAWGYDSPTPAYAAIAGHVALYAGRIDECRIGGEVVQPQPGGFYGGWITANLTGPFKGAPGTEGW